MTDARTPGVPPAALVVVSIVSVQFGGAIAATLIPQIGAVGSVWLRLVVSAAVLCAVVRPSPRGRSGRDWAVVAAYGAALGLMNLSFYSALGRLSIGVAVTIEFVGPLALAASQSRTARDAAAVVAAGVGVLLVSGAIGAPLASLDVLSVLLALTAGALWAAYIVTSGWTGARFERLDGLAIALLLGAVALTPVALPLTGGALWQAPVLLKGVGIALLSSLIPYSLELIALRRMPASVFGILLSLEPAAAAVAGLLVLGQHLSATELLGMGAVVLASVVVMRGARPTAEPVD